MTACRINHLVFWADGVLVTPAGQAAWDAIAPGRISDTKTRLELHNLEQGLADGTLLGTSTDGHGFLASLRQAAAQRNLLFIPARLEFL